MDRTKKHPRITDDQDKTEDPRQGVVAHSSADICYWWTRTGDRFSQYLKDTFFLYAPVASEVAYTGNEHAGALIVQ